MASEEPITDAPSIDPPRVAAVKLLGAVLEECQQDSVLSRYAEVDLRAVNEIRTKLQTNPEDPQAATWMRQIAKAWSFRVRNNQRHIRRILDLLDQKS